MAWSDDDLSLGSSFELTDKNADNNNTDLSNNAGHHNNSTNDDYIPESLKDFIAEADAMIGKFDMNQPFTPTTLTATTAITASATTTTPKNKVGDGVEEFQSPPSDIRGPFDTDGSACRPNPVHLYLTESAVKSIALNDEPNVCPDKNCPHINGSCAYRLMYSSTKNNSSMSSDVTTPTNNNAAAANHQHPNSTPNSIASEVADTPIRKLDSVLENECREEEEEKNQLALQTPRNTSNDMEIDEKNHVDDKDNLITESIISTSHDTPQLCSSSKEHEEEMMDIDEEEVDEEDFFPSQPNEDTIQMDGTPHDNNDEDINEEDGVDDNVFLPKSITSLGIPHCDTMKQSNVTKRFKTSNTAATTSTTNTSLKARTKSDTTGKQVSVKKTSSRRKTTIPKSPVFNTEKRRGSRKYSGVGSSTSGTSSSLKTTKLTSSTLLGKLFKKSNRRKTTIPKGPTLKTEQLHGAKQYSGASFRDETKESPQPKMDYKTKPLTVPKTPNLLSKKKLGNRRYSGVGGMQKIVTAVEEKQRQREIDYKTKTLTIAKAPKLSTTAKHGERKYSGVGTRIDKEKVNQEVVKKIDYKTKKPTVPQAPKLNTTAKHGERTYSAVGKRHEETVTITEPIDKPVIDYKTKKPTVPHAPKLNTTAKHGERTYSAVGKRNEEVKVMPEPIEKPVIDYKTKKPTVPHAPKLNTTAKHGERKYSAVGKRNEKVFSPQERKLGWTNRKATVPKSFNLSTAERSPRKKKDDDVEDMYTFKAMPIMPGILDENRTVSRKVSKRVPTVPKPFRLQTEERIPEKIKNTNPKERKKRYSFKKFRARPVPDFTRPSIVQTPSKPATEPNPFLLKTDEKAASPRKERISRASDDIRKALDMNEKRNKKRIVTTPKPFNFTHAECAASPRKQGSSPSKLIARGRIKSPRAVTKTKPFHFHTEERVRSPSPTHRSPRPLMKDLLQFLSPRKKRKVTVPKPFCLSTRRPKSPQKVKESKPVPIKKVKKHYKPPPPPPEVKRSTHITKLRPFSLSQSNISPTKTSNDRTSISSSDFSSLNRNKDDCPIEFRRKLLLRSARTRHSKGDRGEQAKKVVNQLEELSALVQQTII